MRSDIRGVFYTEAEFEEIQANFNWKAEYDKNKDLSAILLGIADKSFTMEDIIYYLKNIL